MEDPQMTWQDSGDVLQGIMVGPDAHHPPTLTMGDSASTLLDLHLNTDLSSLEAHPPTHNHSFLGPWSSSSSTEQNFYYPHHYPSRLTGAQDAWNPLQVTGVPSSGMSHLNVSPGGDDYAFQKPHYRTPSDSGSQYMGSLISGDSGYASNNGAPQSVVASSYGMDSSPHLSAKEHDLKFGEALAFYDQQQQPHGMGVGNMFMKDDCSSLSLESVKCDHPACSWIGKCPSDKRKHEARHRKSFKCDEANCPRKEGFGTINDLARHKKCVHNKEPERGPKMMYLCFGKNCPRPNKRWPRLDNFKQHLSRMHHEEDADALLKKSMDWYESVTGHRGQKIEDTSQDDSMLDIPHDMMSTHSGDLDADGDIAESYCSYDAVDFPSSRDPTPRPFQSTQHLEVSPIQQHSQFLSPPRASDSRIERSNANPETFVSDAADNLITAMTKKMNNRHQRQSHNSDEGIELEPENPNLSQPQRQILQKVLLAALDRLSDDASASVSVPPAPVLVPVPVPAEIKQEGFQCDLCPKRTRLRCEMKKHQKRHERPYGCTFPHCAKSFGSKADWKRHESSQHLHITSWLCNSDSGSDSHEDGSDSCGRIFYREETYIQHLTQSHHIAKAKLKSTLSTTRLDLADSRHFWCGFCNRSIYLTPGVVGAAALDERFNHIDVEHFKKGERGGDWCFPSRTSIGGGDEDGEGQRRKRRCPGL